MIRCNNFATILTLLTMVMIFRQGKVLMLDITSRDIVVLVNDSVSLICTVNTAESIQWHQIRESEPRHYVYAGGRFYLPYKGRLRLDRDPTTETVTLVIPDVKPGDAGRYDCSEEDSGKLLGSTYLTVFDSTPVCTSNMNPDGYVGQNTCNLQQEVMHFTCSVSFDGKPPQVIWRTINRSEPANESNCENRNGRINCNLTLTSDPEFDGSTFICQTTNLVHKLFSCSTDVIKIQYFTSENGMTIVEKNVNEKINCSVRSNQNLHFKWLLSQDNEEQTFLSTKQVIVIEKPGIHKCLVDYSIRNVNCSSLASIVNGSLSALRRETNENGSKLWWIFLVISILLLMIIIMIGINLYVKRHRDSVAKFNRLVYIQMKLANTIADLGKGQELLDKLKELHALTEDDFKEINTQNSEYDRIYTLLSVIVNRINERYDFLKQALIYHRLPLLAGYLENGELISIHITTSRTDIDDALSDTLNRAVIKEPDLFNAININIVLSKPDASIELLIYCGDVESMKTFIEIFNSDELEQNLCIVLNQLLLKIEPSNSENLLATVKIDQEDVLAIQEFTGINDVIKDKDKIIKRVSNSLPSAVGHSDDDSQKIKDEGEHRISNLGIRNDEETRSHDVPFVIKTRHSDKVLDVFGGNPGSGTEVITFSMKQWYNWNNQLWYEDRTTGTIRSRLNSYCLDYKENNYNIVVNPFVPENPYQQWKRDGMMIRNRNDINRVIAVSDKRKIVMSYDNQEGFDQQFDFLDVPGLCEPYTRRDFYIISEKNNTVLDIEEQNPSPGACVVMCPRTDAPTRNQLWYFDMRGVIHSSFNDLVIESKDGNQVRMAMDSQQNSEHWTVIGKRIVSKENEFLQIKIEDNRECAGVISNVYLRSEIQQWRLEFV